MFVVCGEALMDVFSGERTTTGLVLDARIGGSPFNMACGLARLERPVAFLGGVSTDVFGERLMQALVAEAVDTSLVLRSGAPTTLGVVGLDAQGVAHYAFHGHGAADRLLTLEQLPTLPDQVKALQFGSFAMVVEPVGTALRALAARERPRRLIAYDPNVRLNVEPGIGRWQAVVDEMASLAHMVKVSAEDLAMLYPGIGAAEIARRWMEQGVRLVVVTHGSEGSQAWTRQAHATVHAQLVPVVDTVGAGDTFQAALLTWLDEYGVLDPEGLDALGEQGLRAALGFAGRAAAITCSRRGADLPRRSELD